MENSYNDEVMLIRISDGDLSALQEMIEQYQQYMIMESYLILKDFTQAETIVSDIFVEIWDYRKRLKLDIPLITYLLRAASNKSTELLYKRAGRKRGHPDVIDRFSLLNMFFIKVLK